MSIKWCAWTGVLLIVSALVVVWAFPAPPDEPGVKRRWWDNTIESYEERYNGKLFRRTLYGDDGRTVLRDEQYDHSGALRALQVRRPDGKIEDTTYRFTRLATYTLRSPDGTTTLAQRIYNADGVLLEDTVFSNDGRLEISSKKFYESGKPKSESSIEQSGDQRRKSWYENGQLRSELLIVIQGRANGASYFEDGKLKSTRKQTAESGLLIEEFDRSGTTTFTWAEPPDGKNIIMTIFKDGKPKFRQVFIPEETGRQSAARVLGFVEDLDEKGRVKRKLLITRRDYVGEAQIYREDGTLSTVKFLDRHGVVTRTVKYDETGKTAVSDTTGGEAEPIDTELLNIRRRSSEEDL